MVDGQEPSSPPHPAISHLRIANAGGDTPNEPFAVQILTTTNTDEPFLKLLWHEVKKNVGRLIVPTAIVGGIWGLYVHERILLAIDNALVKYVNSDAENRLAQRTSQQSNFSIMLLDRLSCDENDTNREKYIAIKRLALYAGDFGKAINDYKCKGMQEPYEIDNKNKWYQEQQKKNQLAIVLHDAILRSELGLIDEGSISRFELADTLVPDNLPSEAYKAKIAVATAALKNKEFAKASALYRDAFNEPAFLPFR